MKFRLDVELEPARIDGTHLSQAHGDLDAKLLRLGARAEKQPLEQIEHHGAHGLGHNRSRHLLPKAPHT